MTSCEKKGRERPMPHYVAVCEGCGDNRTLTRARVETGRIVMCQPCQRVMTVVNIGARPKPAPRPREV